MYRYACFPQNHDPCIIIVSLWSLGIQTIASIVCFIYPFVCNLLRIFCYWFICILRKGTSRSKNVENVQIFQSIFIVHTRSTFPTSNLRPSKCCHTGSAEQKRWRVCISIYLSIYDTFATHSGLVDDVTDTDVWAQNGTYSWSYFHNFQTIRVEKLLCVYFVFHFYR